MKNGFRNFLVATVAMLAIELACVQLTPADKAQIAKDQIELSVCASEAHDCKVDDGGSKKCWAIFDDCMTRKGFYEGGADVR